MTQCNLTPQVSRLGQELQVEREKGLAGMSAEQLARMRHINSFLEHNLRENGEMLASLGRLQEEKQEMKAANWGLRDRLADCVCSATEERGKSLYGRFSPILSSSPPLLFSSSPPQSNGVAASKQSGSSSCLSNGGEVDYCMERRSNHNTAAPAPTNGGSGLAQSWCWRFSAV